MIRFYFLIGLAFFVSHRSFSQKIGVDRKGKSVFTHFSTAEARVEISSEEPLSVSYFHPLAETIFTLKKTGDTTVVKMRGINAQVSMLNSGEHVILTDLADPDASPGLGIRLGYQSTIDVFHNINKIPAFYLGTYTWGLNGVLNWENIRLYDSLSNTISRKHPMTVGIEGNFNIFFKNWTGTATRIVFAFTGSVLRTWNDDDLIQYQELSKTNVLPSVVTLKDFKGRYGTLDREVVKSRFSFAFPMYFGRFNPIPYVVYTGVSGKNTYGYGVFINLTEKRLTKIKFKIPSAIGAGIDWISKGGKLSDPSVFVKGSISFGKLKDG